MKLKLRNIFEVKVLTPLFLFGALIWAFIEIADEVIENESKYIDSQIILMLRASGNPSDPLGPVWFEEFVRDVTALGSTGVLTLFTLSFLGYLLLRKQARAALFVTGAIVSGTILNSLLKFGFSRPRPELVAHHTEVMTSSFPSGHAMMSAVTYLVLGEMMAQTQSSFRIKTYFLGLAILLTLLIGLSRVYLGVHWPSDVLAGWTIGAAWAILWRGLSIWLSSTRS